jgi:hypothetical protein
MNPARPSWNAICDKHDQSRSMLLKRGVYAITPLDTNPATAFPHIRRDVPPDRIGSKWRPQGDSNPCYRRERAVS